MFRRSLTPLVVAAALAAALNSSDLVACGDSLYRVGKGVAYRVYTAPLPGNVLIYSDQPGAQDLADAQYDVVIAPYSEHRAVESGTRSAPGTAFLPVARNDEEEDAAKHTYKTVMSAEHDELKHYLKAIHKSLKRKA